MLGAIINKSQPVSLEFDRMNFLDSSNPNMFLIFVQSCLENQSIYNLESASLAYPIFF